MAKLWLTSNDIIEDVKRSISFPISQNTFSEDDILAFANKELSVGIVPDLMAVHEEYFVYKKTVPLVENQNAYGIPDRAIGQKLRDVYFQDSSGNLGEMTRIDSDDRAYFQQSVNAYSSVYKFYLENNNVVLTPNISNTSDGSLLMTYFLRPNMLVQNIRAATVTGFYKSITVTNAAGVVAGNTVVLGAETYTAVVGSPGAFEFQTTSDGPTMASNLAAAINTYSDIASAVAGTAGVVIGIPSPATSITVDSSGLSLDNIQGVTFDQIPTNFVNGMYVDFLQTKAGHKTKGMDVLVPTNAISGTSISFTGGDVPSDLVIGDYVCEQYECIIPQIPSDLHYMLVERTGARILSAIGDLAGLNASNTKIAEMTKKQESLIFNRVEGAPQKVFARNSPLRNGRRGYYRGY